MKESQNPKELIANLPDSPGVYKFFDKNKQLIYVGKAKSLKNRVGSYFSGKQYNRKTQKLVAQIAHFEYTLVNSEYDALLLENSLIKAHQPKYNILLKDDKTFPFICITHEPFPRIIVTRKPDTFTGTLYGPFTGARMMNVILDLIKELYTIRNCSLQLTKKNIEAKKFKVCLEYHLGRCKGPCEALQDEQDYGKDIEGVNHILKGNTSLVSHYFKEKMLEAAKKMEFEKAAEFKQKLNKLDIFQTKSQVVNPKIRDVDVFSIVSDENNAYINVLKVKNGSIAYTDNMAIKKKLDETDGEILTLVVTDLRTKLQSQADEILSNIPLNTEIQNAINTIPKIGDKKKLLDLSLKNALYFKKDQSSKTANTEKKPNQAVIELQNALQMASPPLQIECFDNSNIQGTNPVASMVYFAKGKPLKKEYRHFNIKTVEGPNDFASMHEIVYRRYKRSLEEKKELPDLIIIDGGKGQLSAACDALKELNLYGQKVSGKIIKIIGIAKRLEEIYLPEDEIPLHINKKSLALKLIQQVRDEAHRFAIEFHRDKRSKSSLNSQLEEIKGIGQATMIKLLQHFKTIQRIKEMDITEIAKVVGKSKAEIVKKNLL